MVDLTSDKSFGLERVQPNEQAVFALLKEPALEYVRELRRTLDNDPNFLTYHDRSVGLKIQSFLSKQGIFWDDEVFERQFRKVLMEPITRLRSAER